MKTGSPPAINEVTNGEPVGLGRQLRQESTQFRGRFELGNRIEFLERAGERIRQAPHRARREFLILGLEVQPMDFRKKTPWGFELSVHERRIEDQLCSFIGDLRLTPLLHLTTHRFKASLNPVDTHG